MQVRIWLCVDSSVSRLTTDIVEPYTFVSMPRLTHLRREHEWRRDGIASWRYEVGSKEQDLQFELALGVAEEIPVARLAEAARVAPSTVYDWLPRYSGMISQYAIPEDHDLTDDQVDELRLWIEAQRDLRLLASLASPERRAARRRRRLGRIANCRDLLDTVERQLQVEVVLAAEDGLPRSLLAEAAGMARSTVYAWQQRYSGQILLRVSKEIAYITDNQINKMYARRVNDGRAQLLLESLGDEFLADLDPQQIKRAVVELDHSGHKPKRQRIGEPVAVTGSRRARGSARRASGEAAKLADALTEERNKVGSLGIWYDLHRDWLEVMAEVAHSWGTPDPVGWSDTIRSHESVWKVVAWRQATIWTTDADAVIGDQPLSPEAAEKISQDPIGAAMRASVEARLVPRWYGHQILQVYGCDQAVAADSAMPTVITELSHHGWDPQSLTPPERFAWEMIPKWIWRRHVRLTVKHDEVVEVADVPEPPWSDPLVLEVSEWWARRNTELLDEELCHMSPTMEPRLQQLAVERTQRAARRGLGPAVLERLAFTVRREGWAEEDVHDALTECEQVMQEGLRKRHHTANSLA